MPASTAGPVSRYRLALGRIPGLEIDDSIILPGVPGRQFLASNKYCSDGALEARQSVNGLYLVQTVDWFLEFAPTNKQNDHHNEQFWALVRDETGIDIERLTPNNIEKIYVAFQDMRRLFKTKYRYRYPGSQKDGIPDAQIFFIDLLDKSHCRFTNRTSRFQLHYGLRRDENFGERMASRVLQWRLRLQHPEDLLLEFPQMGLDVLPIEQQDDVFKKMAEKYARIFNKTFSKTVVDVATDDASKLQAEISNYSPKTAMLKTIGLQLTGLKADIEKKTTDMETKYDLMGRSIYRSIEDMQKKIDAMGTDLKKKQDDAEESLSAIATDMVETKKKVSYILRQSK
ncbi:hypothetical protein VMCG_07817 [Cytospora schulzeri]|uniref:Uncharacterized protein n=1 Tax=Cytospora schulzeri TaxID=448051 RepID=A0A423VZS9_9PEZI|nr:hypothetical protein VMCG_07817 [Valsa malicola]